MLDRIKQSTNTTGTGAYTLADADQGYYTLFDAWDFFYGPPGVVPYVVTDGTDWEAGYGTFDGNDPGTVERTVIVASSAVINGDPISWTAGAKTFMVAGLSSTGPFGARWSMDDAVPTSGSDETLGYTAGSFSYVSGVGGGADGLYFCIDPTTASAVWVHLLNSETSVLNDRELVLSGDYTRGRQQGDTGVTLNPDDDTSSNTYARTSSLAFTKTTTASTDNPFLVWCPPGAGILTGTIVAKTDAAVPADIDVAIWKIEVAYRTDTTTPFDIITVGTPAVTLVHADTALAGMGVTVGVYADAVDDKGLTFTQTGVVADTVTWSMHATINEVVNFTVTVL